MTNSTRQGATSHFIVRRMMAWPSRGKMNCSRPITMITPAFTASDSATPAWCSRASPASTARYRPVISKVTWDTQLKNDTTRPPRSPNGARLMVKAVVPAALPARLVAAAAIQLTFAITMTTTAWVKSRPSAATSAPNATVSTLIRPPAHIHSRSAGLSRRSASGMMSIPCCSAIVRSSTRDIFWPASAKSFSQAYGGNVSGVFQRYIDRVANPAASGRRPRPAGIREVAAAAGVSPTTVSHALNGMGRLSEATRQHVLDVAARLGYRANPSARNMRSGASGIIAVIDQLSHGASFQASDLEYIMRLNQAICRAAWDADCYPTLLPPGVNKSFLGRIPLDGAILADPVRQDGTLRALDELGIPAVTVGRDGGCEPDRQWWADNDIAAATRGALDHLAAGGAERVCLVSADTGQSYMTDAVDAYLGWSAERGAPTRLRVLGSPVQRRGLLCRGVRRVRGPAARRRPVPGGGGAGPARPRRGRARPA